MNKLSKYMLSDNNINNILNNIPNINTQNITKKENSQHNYINTQSFFSPNYGDDSLFWCIYIFINDINTYLNNKTNLYQHGNKIKMEYIKKAKENKQLLKNYKIKYRDVEGNLSTDKKINITTLKAICILENINLIFFTEKLLYGQKLDDDNDNCYIRYVNNKYSVWIKDNEPDRYNILGSRIIVDNIDKPIRSMSYYKKDDLRDMVVKLGIFPKDHDAVASNKNRDCYTKSKLYALVKDNI